MHLLSKHAKAGWTLIILAFALTSTAARSQEPTNPKSCEEIIESAEIDVDISDFETIAAENPKSDLEDFQPNRIAGKRSKLKTLSKLGWEVLKYGTGIIVVFKGQQIVIPMLDQTERVIAAGVLGAVMSSSLTSITNRLTAWGQQQNFVVYNLVSSLFGKRNNHSHSEKVHIEGEMGDIYNALNGRMNPNASIARGVLSNVIRFIYDPIKDADAVMTEYMSVPEEERNPLLLDKVYRLLALGCTHMGEVYPDFPFEEPNVVESVRTLFHWEVDLNRLYQNIQADSRIKAKKGKLRQKSLEYYTSLLGVWFPQSLK